MTYRRVAITGLGLVSPFAAGESAQQFFSHLMAGESGIALYTPEPTLLSFPVPALRCADFDHVAALGRGPAYLMDRNAQLGTTAAAMAWQDAGLELTVPPTELVRGAVCWGTGLGGTSSTESAYFDVLRNGRNRVSPLLIVMAMHNAAAAHIAMKFGLGGPATTASVACASSAMAIGEAMRLIRDGMCDLAVAGGSEAPLTAGMLLSWDAMRVLAKGDAENAHAACRPFHLKRSGLVLGEGGVALVLESFERAQARGARIYAEAAGFGASCDHHHLAQPLAAGQVRAIKSALDDAGLDAGDIGYINAHGTATLEGDPIEIEAVRTAIGPYAAEVAVSATKSMHGHMLGATGALEALITALALHRQEVPPTAHLDALDPACEGVQHVALRGQARAMDAALSNSFAFGGSNAVLALRRVH